jgi:hypothetical protein
LGKKRRAKLKDLKRVKEFGEEYLSSKKLILPKENSALAHIRESKDSPILPGIPEYLPYPWTINATRRIIFDLACVWLNNNKNDPKMQENVSEFFKFVIKELEMKKEGIKNTMLFSVIKKEYDLKLFHKKGAIEGIAKFLVDSFAVSVIEKSNSSVSEYLEWFLRWTESLLNQWGSAIRRIDAPKQKTT